MNANKSSYQLWPNFSSMNCVAVKRQRKQRNRPVSHHVDRLVYHALWGVFYAALSSTISTKCVYDYVVYKSTQLQWFILTIKIIVFMILAIIMPDNVYSVSTHIVAFHFSWLEGNGQMSSWKVIERFGFEKMYIISHICKMYIISCWM